MVGYNAPLGEGRLNANIAYNYNDTEVQGGFGSTIANEDQKVRFEQGRPQHNGTASLGYDLGAIGLMARARYYGPWTDSSGNATGDIHQRFGSIVLFDLSASYDFTENVTLTLGAENLFDTYPDEATFQAVRGLIYSRNAPYDTDGGQYYARLKLRY